MSTLKVCQLESLLFNDNKDLNQIQIRQMNRNIFKVSFYVLILIVIFNNYNTVNAQHTVPERGDNVILIVGENMAENNFISFGKFLVTEGFSFASKDKEFLFLSTNEKTSKGGYKYTLTVSFQDSLILIRPRCNYVLLGSSIGNIKTEWTDWSYAKAKKSPVGIAFNAFEPILMKYNGKLYYKEE